MSDLRKMGGISALIMAATFVLGIGFAVTVLEPYQMGDLDPVQKVAFMVDNQAIMYIWNQIIYLVFGVFLVVLALALYDRLKDGSQGMIQTATVYGLIWAGLMFASGMVYNIGSGTVINLFSSDQAQAASIWLAVESVWNGLGGGNEIVGGLWILLVSWAALRAGGLPKPLNYFGLLIAVAGIITIIPGLDVLGFIFGLGTIVWFVWLGIVMLRSGPGTAA